MPAWNFGLAARSRIARQSKRSKFNNPILSSRAFPVRIRRSLVSGPKHGFGRVACKPLLGDPTFEKYPDFKKMLDYLASENCKGCRNEQCKLFKNCKAHGCHQEKQIDFCYQCDMFPCNRTNFDENLHNAWVRIDEIIRNEGLKTYYERTLERPRYI